MSFTITNTLRAGTQADHPAASGSWMANWATRSGNAAAQCIAHFKAAHVSWSGSPSSRSALRRMPKYPQSFFA